MTLRTNETETKHWKELTLSYFNTCYELREEATEIRRKVKIIIILVQAAADAGVELDHHDLQQRLQDVLGDDNGV